MATATIGAAKAISILRSAIVNARIYPAGSQMIESSLKGAHQALESCLQDVPQVTISDIHGKLCINGKEAVEARDFRPFLVQNEVQSLTFSKGVSLAEIASLVDILGKRKEKSAVPGVLAGQLKEKGVTHVQAEEIHFVAIQKGEVVVQQVTQLLEQSNDVPTLVSSLEESFRLIGQIQEPNGRQEVRKQIAHHLTTLPPHQLRELFETKLPEEVEKAGLKDEVVQSLSREKLEETVEEVHKWYQEVKQQSKSEFEVMEKLSGLKSFLNKLLQSPASKQVSFALYEELLNVGLIDEMPKGVEKGDHTSLLAQVEQLLSQSAADLLAPGLRQKFPDLLKALCAMGLEEPLQKLTDKVLENLQNPTPLVRQTAVKTLRQFEEIMAANRKEKPFSIIVTALHKLAESESSPDVYGETALALQEAAMELLVNWRFEESALLLGMLRRHSRDESPIGQKKKQQAAQALREFSNRGLEVVCADLNSLMKDRQNGAYRVLAELGEEAVGPLMESIKRSTDSRSRQAAIQALKRLGPVVKEPLLKHLHVGVPGDILVKLLPLLDEFADASLLPALTALLQHPEGSVRRAVGQLLVRIKDPKAEKVFLTLLDDSDDDIQEETVRMAGEQRYAGAAAEFIRRLPASHASVQEEICIALGRLSDRTAIPALIKLLQARGSFWNRSKGTPEAVRVRAVWALGQMLPSSEAEQILQKAQKDSSPVVQRAAQQALVRTATPHSLT